MLESFINAVSADPFWISLGFLGQLIIGSRFLIQWLASELKKKSHIPVSFWHFSLAGSIMLLIYSIHKFEPVFVIGVLLNGLIYARNLYFIYGKKKN